MANPLARLPERTLRTPAALVVVGMAVLLAVGEFVLRDDVPVTRILLDGSIVCAFGLPFLLPWSWFATRGGPRLLLIWIGAATLLATARCIQMLVWFYPRRPLVIWLVLQGISLFLCGPLWLAAYAAWRRVPGGGRPPLGG